MFIASRGKTRVLLGAWALSLAAGFAVVTMYDTTPSSAALAPLAWPVSTRIAPAAPGRSTLLVFAHPKCPCTAATLADLALVLEHHRDALDARVLFVRPPGVESGWERTQSWERASHIDGVTMLVDEAGQEAERFGVKTSGQVLLFSPGGRLAFSGGITGSRGHEGANAALDALETELSGLTGALVRTPVFGCSLLADACTAGSATCRR
jgi:hypothetical protein